MIKKARGGFEDPRDAVVILANLVVAALKLAHARIVDKTADEQVQLAVVVVVKPNCACRPAWRGHARLVSHVGERAVMVVFVQDALAVGGDKHVRPAVVVVIADRDSHSEICAGNSGLFRNVSECAVSIVLVQRIANGFRGLPEIAGATIDQKNIHPAVVVEIEKRAARSQRLGQ